MMAPSKMGWPGSAATTKRGPPRANVDSRLRGNDMVSAARVCRGAKPLCRESEEPVSKPFVPVNIETQDYEWG